MQNLMKQLEANRQFRNERIYKTYMIHDCSPNSSGMKYFAFGNKGTLRADTLKGIKQLINKDIKNA